MPADSRDDRTRRAAGIDRAAALADYRLAWESRHAAVIGRTEVMTGKAKFGIFGDGKELPQLAMARVFERGDFRSGYYRDQTFMLAAGMTTLEELFAQLYANPDPGLEPASGGRQMNSHFATRLLDDAGEWRDQTETRNSAADLSPLGSQMPRLVGLGLASRLYRELDGLRHAARFSRGGREIAFGTIGNASCAEGMFWEALNAIGVLRAPVLLSIWDDGYGISVPNELQVCKRDLSQLLQGFARASGGCEGFDLHGVAGWDYPALLDTYARAAARVREEQVPAIVHVRELTQPQGHSTSGSHERYKPAERLEWEREHDGLARMRGWLVASGLAAPEELERIEREALERVRGAQRKAWEAYAGPLREETEEVAALLEEVAGRSPRAREVEELVATMRRAPVPLRRNAHAAALDALRLTRGEEGEARRRLAAWRTRAEAAERERWGSHLEPGPGSAAHVPEVKPFYPEDAPSLNGFELLNRAFDLLLERRPEVVAFGEDVGRLGDVNQGMAGLQAKHGALRVADTGIRECTIVGQAIGLALRGLRPIAEIQYLDYVLYALQILSDDLATLHYRTRGGQKAPVVVRTRGHRLEGIWHSGSPMAGIVHLVRGMHVCVPRDMTRAAGMYNALARSDSSAIVVEVLNGYRLKERLPANLGDLTVPPGLAEVLREGSDLTVVTYGACCRVALEAARKLEEVGIDVEVIDVQTLLPFDREGAIRRSIEKTSRVLFLDEDVPGGATAYMLQEALERQHAWEWLDSEPRTVTAAAHRPAYGSDGDYWSKPSAEDVFLAAYEILHEARPRRHPIFWR